MQASDRPDQYGIVERLLMYIGEEKNGNEGLLAAQKDVETKFAGGFPELFYGDIQFLPVYAAAGNKYGTGLMKVASGKVCCLAHWRDAYHQGCYSDQFFQVGSCYQV